MKKAIFLGALFISFASIAQKVNIIPQPNEIKVSNSNKKFELTAATKIYYSGNEHLKKDALYLQSYLQQYYQLKPEVLPTTSKKTEPYIFLQENNTNKQGHTEGAYTMEITKKSIEIASENNTDGVFCGIQTLIQLLPTTTSNIEIPQLSIKDAPRFQYRGMHLDVSRHFFPVSFIKKYIDYLAYHKLNEFHWHLTDDQGWRIEIKKYPKLTSIGAWRNGTLIGRYPGTGNDNKKYGGYYTQEEIKEVVQYAKDRHIDVIPEIEMPGHSSAAIAAYPWLSCFPNEPTAIPKNMISEQSKDELQKGPKKLVQETWGVFDDIFCAGKDSTFMFLDNVIDEVCALFPSKYLHIGGDEAPKTHWAKCPVCQERMKKMGLKDEHELQSWFVQRIEKYVNSKGKTLIGWDEILEGGLAPNAVVMSWRGEAGGIQAAKEKHDVIMTPGNPVYFDHSQTEYEDSITIGGYNPIEKVYAYNPIPKELSQNESHFVLGSQANVWTEYIGNTAKVEYMIFPRMAALSEVLWTELPNKNWENFANRLPAQLNRYKKWGANYSKAFFDLKTEILPTADRNGILWKLTGKTDDSIHIRFLEQDNELVYTEPLLIKTASTPVCTYSVDNQKMELSQSFIFNKATGKNISLEEPASENYPGDGAFTLVNGVVNTKGLGRSKEFLGFDGKDCNAFIDLGEIKSISSVVVHTMSNKGSWIWEPSSVNVTISDDGKNYTPAGQSTNFISNKNTNGIIQVDFNSKNARYIRIDIKNHGTIEDGNPGAGHKAWLFVDEIEVK